MPEPRLTRRRFLEASAAALALTLVRLAPGETAAAPATRAARTYRSFADVYRQQWTWDRVVRGTHYANCGYQRCAWNVYVKDGLVWREEQAGTYPQTNSDVADFNPRGCQKGACWSHRMYDPSRLRVPLKRAGKRGEGKWKRVSWEEALTDIAQTIVRVLGDEAAGPGAVYWDLGSASSNGCHSLGLTRTAYLLDTPIFENTAEMGDHMPGVAATAGKIVFTGSLDDLFYSDLILIWGGNPNYTHIPNAHFIYEARYNGAYIVAVAPDYSPSVIHADEWVPLNPGSDAALALSIAQVIVEERLYDEAFLAEQTDMPLLVRRDNGRLLRRADFAGGGADDVFFFFDRASGRIVEAPRRTLALEGRRPALEGHYEVATADGTVRVEPVFELLRAHLKAYRPERTAPISGVPPGRVRALARRIARARACTNICQTNFSKYYHGLEMERALLLVFALAGHFGKHGAGYSAIPMLSVSGAEPLSIASGKLPPKMAVGLLALSMAPEAARLKLAGYSDEMIVYEAARRDYARGNLVTTALFHWRHGGLRERYGSARRWDESLPREFDAYLADAVERGWQFVPERPPRVLFSVGGNMLRRVRGYDRMIEELLERLDLLVTFDIRMSNTALYSDYVLPAAGWYEKDDIAWSSALVPFSHATVEAVPPLGESKSDWAFHCLLLEKIQQVARAQGVTKYRDRSGQVRRLDTCYDEFTFGGRLRPEAPGEVLDTILSVSTNIGSATWKDLQTDGFKRFTGVSHGAVYIGNATDIRPGETVVANAWHVQKKIPWPTLTRRLQFYIDHPLFAELGEVLPVHKNNPPIGGDYPLQMTSGHNRWSIHAAWRDHCLLLRLQRGEPVVYVASEDARRRGIRDGDRVRLRNDLGECVLVAKVSPCVRPGQVIVYHAWEPYQFERHRSIQRLLASPINPIQLAGGYFHLQPMVMSNAPGGNDRGTRVELERVPR